MICYVSCQGDELMLEQQEEEEGMESFIAHVPVPSQKEVSLSRYLSLSLPLSLTTSLSTYLSLCFSLPLSIPHFHVPFIPDI